MDELERRKLEVGLLALVPFCKVIADQANMGSNFLICFMKRPMMDAFKEQVKKVSKMLEEIEPTKEMIEAMKGVDGVEEYYKRVDKEEKKDKSLTA